MSWKRDDDVKHKLALLRLAETLGNVSRACEIMGFSRDTFYRFQKLYERGGEMALRRQSRRKPLLKNRVDEEVERAVLEMALRHPGYGQQRVSMELERRDIFVSSGGVRSIWKRHGVETYSKRLRALRLRTTGGESSGSSIDCGAREAAVDRFGQPEKPGHLGAHTIRSLKTARGFGAVVEYTFIDVYSQLAFVRLHDQHSRVFAAEMLTGHVIPWYDRHGVALRRVVADWIDDPRSRARAQAAVALSQSFHETIQVDFYSRRLGSGDCRTARQLEVELGPWLEDYNLNRLQDAGRCLGRTPMQTFMDDKE